MMQYPEFYDQVEPIILKDDLSAFLGASVDGIIEISYLEMVKMAGHSCVVVSGAYLMAQYGLKALFGSELPKRGEIKVELRERLGESNTGVFAQVYSNITGATTNNGFGGIGPHFNRRGLLFYGVNIDANVRFTRLDTNQSVDVIYSPQKVANPSEIMQSYFGPDATDKSKAEFPEKWQAMVKTIFDRSQDIIEVREV